MDDQSAFMAAIAANPRDVNAHLALADWMEERPEMWRRTEEPCPCACHSGRPDLTPRNCEYETDAGILCDKSEQGRVIIDRTDWSYHLTPIYLHRVLWPLALQWEDERWHGTEPQMVIASPPHCPKCKTVHCGLNLRGPRPGPQRYICAQCSHQWPCELMPSGTVTPTFALLLDRPGDEPCEECGGSGDRRPTGGSRSNVGHFKCPTCSGSGKAVIDGHLTQLVQQLRAAGDPLAEELGKLTVKTAIDFDVPTQGYAVDEVFYSSRLDALRELHRRVWQAMTEECPDQFGMDSVGCKSCVYCHGLGWRLRLANEVAKTVG